MDDHDLPTLEDFEAARRVLEYLNANATRNNPLWIPYITETKRLVTAAILVIKADE